jgi:filamentous hemagglutinin family protein
MTPFIRQPIILTSIGLLMATLPTALAQNVVLDGTLGRSDALSGPTYEIGAELGQRHGGNLFHSFDKFSLNSSERATFSAPESVTINNVISRVTGGNPSNIDGTLRSTIPNADMYFLNPYGIMFGPNARLDVQGSFHASTADTLRFQDGGQFNARNPSNSLLSVAPIEAFGFITESPERRFSVVGSELSVPTGKTLSLIGGNLNINQAKLTAQFGRINLASFAGLGEVSLTKFEDLAGEALGGDFRITDSEISTTGDGGGAIYIRGGQIVVENSLVEANSGTEDGEVNGTEDGIGINLKANNLTLKDGRLVAYTFGKGKGGDIKIDVAGLVELRLGRAEEGTDDDDTTHASNELISVRTEGAGDGGHVKLNARELNIKEGRHIGTYALGSGQGGDINITMTEDITLDGTGGKLPSIIAAQSDKGTGKAGNVILKARTITLKNAAMINTSSTGQGDSGDINLEAIQLSIKDGASISSSTFGPSPGGNIYAKVTESITISGKPFGISPNTNRPRPNGIFSSSEPHASSRIHPKGNAGDIVLEADQLIMKGPGLAVVSALTAVGSGEGGKIKIRVRGLDLADKSTISATSVAGASGDAGNITLDVTDSLRMQSGSSVRTATQGRGKGGEIEINVCRLDMADKSGISAQSRPHPAGRYKGPMGDAGNIRVNVIDLLRMQTGSSIRTTAERSGGGDIFITSSPGYLFLTDDSEISSSVFAEQGDGGNISLKPKFIVLDNSPPIQARAYEGKGGNIKVTATGIYNNDKEGRYIRPKDSFDATSDFGIDGEVKINSPDVDLETLLLVLPEDPLRAEDELGNRCAGLTREDLSRFIIINSDTPATSPMDSKTHLIFDD